VVEKHGFVLLGPREVESWQDALLLRYSVLERTFVEGHRREVGKARVHSILHLEADWANTQTDKAFEQTLVQSGFGCLFAHDDGSELAVITNENDVFCPLQDWDQGLWFGCLGGLVNQHLSKSEVANSPVKSSNAGGANDIGVLQNFVFSLPLQFFQSFIVFLV